MFFTIDELVRWLGLTIFEIWINLISLLAFTLILAFKFNPDVEIYSNNWWLIFFPLFLGDALNAYYCIIIFIRMLMAATLKFSTLRLMWSTTFLTLTFMFKFLLCKKLLAQLSLDYSEVFAPVYILLQLIAVRACQQS
ncbi:transmembrane protein 203-like isoform X2 [Cylas formicarius]|uniref:transmembrane protein 203-like isoform X2 n=1 Tax=Cylas formicarius TaxID=197179 RepID=UPI002958A357|nr:transmembrane protein 203-like isoform X2 [Cylas formicarius]